MGALDLTLQVVNLPLNATKEDLLAFFSYCGTVVKIQLQRDGDQSQKAFVTFRQPYALQIALLLNSATIGDRRVRILPLENMRDIPITSSDSENMDSQEPRGYHSPASPLTAAVHAKPPIVEDIPNKAKERVSAVERKVHDLSSAIVSSDCLLQGAVWLSEVLERASKSVAELRNVRGLDINSRMRN
ncbi:uncharacterized protein LOC109723220 [Ananas comosus]|uniref:Uncharacterized protein LOC109723220 n=1 Tax=Ananas comosus TaxID=4615 RepID=A0A6P5GER4_ANACO|nr:uncharacterized protein LOC109723220 [Ananas comosus]